LGQCVCRTRTVALDDGTKKEETSDNETLIGKKIMTIKNYKDYFAPILQTEDINISLLDNDDLETCDIIHKNKDPNAKYESEKIKYIGQDTLLKYYVKTLSNEKFINIFIENLRNSSLEPNVPITFKVPITVANGSVEYFFEGIRFPQSICIRDPDFTIDRLNISVRDRFGQPLDNNGVDWTFTLEFISDT
jgi:hypothetical protein